MNVGDKKTVEIPCAEAYGEAKEEMIGNIPHDQFPEGMNPEAGQMLQVQTPQGPFPVKVVEVKDDGVVIDANHPLAGKDLTFELTLVEVVD